MLDFNFCVSTNFIFGKDTHKHVGETAAALGVKKVMLALMFSPLPLYFLTNCIVYSYHLLNIFYHISQI